MPTTDLATTRVAFFRVLRHSNLLGRRTREYNKNYIFCQY
jgi:hypothetical protein